MNDFGPFRLVAQGYGSYADDDPRIASEETLYLNLGEAANLAAAMALAQLIEHRNAYLDHPIIPCVPQGVEVKLDELFEHLTPPASFRPSEVRIFDTNGDYVVGASVTSRIGKRSLTWIEPVMSSHEREETERKIRIRCSDIVEQIRADNYSAAQWLREEVHKLRLALTSSSYPKERVRALCHGDLV